MTLFQAAPNAAHGFSALWARYPNKNGKKDAEKAYGQVVTSAEIEGQIHAALDWQLVEWASLDWYHPPYLATYLRKARYQDEPPMKTASPVTKLLPWQQRAIGLMHKRDENK